MAQYEVIYYQNSRGDKIVKQFIFRQDIPAQAKIERFITLLTIKGPDLGMPYSRNLGKGLYELRIRGKNEVRIFYIAVYNPNQIILLHAFKKRSQKLPDKEIKVARNRQKG